MLRGTSQVCLRQLVAPVSGYNVKRPIASFILKYDDGDDPEFTILGKESFDITLRMKYAYSATNIRCQQPGAVMFPEEKAKNEVAVM